MSVTKETPNKRTKFSEDVGSPETGSEPSENGGSPVVEESPGAEDSGSYSEWSDSRDSETQERRPGERKDFLANSFFPSMQIEWGIKDNLKIGKKYVIPCNELAHIVIGSFDSIGNKIDGCHSREAYKEISAELKKHPVPQLVAINKSVFKKGLLDKENYSANLKKIAKEVFENCGEQPKHKRRAGTKEYVGFSETAGCKVKIVVDTEKIDHRSCITTMFPLSDPKPGKAYKPRPSSSRRSFSRSSSSSSSSSSSWTSSSSSSRSKSDKR